jgi:hypothetical protein
MLSLVQENGKYTIYDPKHMSKTVTVGSALDASKRIFNLLQRSYDSLTDKLAICVSVYKTLRRQQ